MEPTKSGLPHDPMNKVSPVNAWHIIAYLDVHTYLPVNTILEMCSVSTNGERASPAKQGSQLIGCLFFDKHANT